MTKSNKNIKTTQTLKNPVINNKLQNVLKINSFKNNNHLLDNISNSMSISYEKFPVNLHPTKGKRKENESISENNSLCNLKKNLNNISDKNKNIKVNNLNLNINNINIDFEKEKSKLDSINKQFLNSNEYNGKNLELNSNNFPLNNLDLNLFNENIIINSKSECKNKTKEFLEMMFLFTEFNKITSSNINQRVDFENISKKISNLIFGNIEEKNINNSTKQNSEFKNKNNFNNSLKNENKINNCNSNNSLIHSNNFSEKNFEIQKSIHNSNSLAKARLEKEKSKNNHNPAAYRNLKSLTYRSSNPDSASNLLYRKDLENPFKSSMNFLNNDKKGNNKMNSSLIEDIPLENPFNNISGKIKNKNSNNNIYNIQLNVSKIIKIQKIWRKWTLKKIIAKNKLFESTNDIKGKLFNFLSKDEKLNNLIDTIYNAINLYSNIRMNNSKSKIYFFYI